jgi:hypothetical protein
LCATTTIWSKESATTASLLAVDDSPAKPAEQAKIPVAAIAASKIKESGFDVNILVSI